MEFRILFAAVSLLFTFVEVTAKNYGNCKPIYRRYSDTHSACQPRNPQCHIVAHGVNDQDTMDKIIEVHNRLRSVIANQEEGSRGLPPAADMLELEWDQELANVAQKRADQCIYKHDDKNARRVLRFSVGQNIGRAGPAETKLEPDWEASITHMFGEIEDFNTREICGDRKYNFKQIGHFTALIWAKTFKVGCGYTQYKDEQGYRELYYCNYGPGGNVDHECIYETGPACSKCPENTECNEELGLCKRINEDVTPLYPSGETYFFNCNFRNPSSKDDCGVHTIGDGEWKVQRTLQFDYVEVVLQPGQNATIIFAKKLTPPDDSDETGFCVAYRYRKGPLLAKNQGNNRGLFLASPDRGPDQSPYVSTSELPKYQQAFQYKSSELPWRYTTKIKFSFAVPRGAKPQFFNLAFVRAYDGECNSEVDMKGN